MHQNLCLKFHLKLQIIFATDHPGIIYSKVSSNINDFSKEFLNSFKARRRFYKV